VNRTQPLRRDLPRKACFQGCADAVVDDCVCSLNSTPRVRLDYRTLIEASAASLAVALHPRIQLNPSWRSIEVSRTNA